MGKEQLNDVREKINRIDEQMIALLHERQGLADEVAKIKRENNISLVDPARETEIVNKVAALVPAEEKADAMIFQRMVMGLSKSRQRMRLFGRAEEYSFPAPQAAKTETPTVAFQGVRGAWAELAANRLFADAVLTNMESWDDVFRAVSDGDADYGVLPIENSQTGGIGEVYDLLRKYGCYIVGQTWVNIAHCLMGIPGTKLSDVREVFSHPEGFKQCRNFLRGKAWDLTGCRNTAVAAERVASENSSRYAAIGSERAAELNGLSVLARDIVSDPSNRTRFILVAALPEYDASCDTVSVIFRTAHRSGALCDVLFPLLAEGINMTRLESRPTGEKGKYCFFCDIDGHIDDQAVRSAFRQIGACCDYLEILGCYRQDTPQR
ncbi:MAG: chorismate mutase [Clostridia bacterium]|nr:chorismate mutase [Clostridia bacterium]